MRLGCALVMLAVAATSAAADTGLDRARAALDRSDYPAAKTALDEALAAGTSTPPQLVEIYKLRGAVFGALDDRDGAREAFVRMLALDPAVTFPPGTSPKTTAPFVDAVAKLAGRRLDVHLDRVTRGFELVVASDPAFMVTAARVAIDIDGVAGVPQRLAGNARIAIAQPDHGRRLSFHVDAVDRDGNVLVALEPIDVDVPPPPPPIVVVTAPPVATRDPIYLRWYLYGGAAAVSGVVATVFAFAARSAAHDLQAIYDDSRHHTYDEASAVESRGHRDVAIADVAFGVAGAFAIAGAIVYVLHHREHGISIAPTANGVAVGARF